MVEKLDFKKTDKAFYTGKAGRWDRLTLPAMQFLMIDGKGDPGGANYARALAALYPVAYAMKFAAKAKAADFVVSPLEALWWADDPSVFVSGQRDAWQWTVMIRMPDYLDAGDFTAARDAAQLKQAKKPDVDVSALDELRFASASEGDCLQILHIGRYSDEAPTLADLHDRLMPEQRLTFNGPHHEVYLSDPRRVAPDRLKTLLRQPVRPL